MGRVAIIVLTAAGLVAASGCAREPSPAERGIVASYTPASPAPTQAYTEYAYYMVDTDPSLLRDAQRLGLGRETAACVARGMAIDTYGQADYALLSKAVAVQGGQPLGLSDQRRVAAEAEAFFARFRGNQAAGRAYLDGLWRGCIGSAGS